MTTGMFANLGEALARLRELRGASQAAIARRAGIGKSQLSKYENGKDLPKLDSLEKILGALEVGYLDLFRMLALTDRGADIQAPTPEELDDLFAKINRGLIALHREVAARGRKDQDRRPCP